MVSDRNLLNLDRPAQWALPRPKRDGATDTIKVCVIRVEFQPDGTPRTTGDGTFDYRPREEAPHPFDPPPHTLAYFDSHMDALRRYYLAVSDSQLFIEWQVFPAASDSLAYRLPDSMGYYGELGWMGGDIADRMQQFFKDSWELAISYGEFNPSEWDAFIVFHAGSDWQNDVASLVPEYVEIWPDIFVPSPDDLPTGYLKLPFTIAGVIEDGIIMPEQAWQDGQYVCINGALAHEFGHQLGLVDLYNTGNFITQVGDFSLMDNGFGVGADVPIDDDGDEIYEDTFSVYGLLPVYPSAWERAYLGWETPLTVVSDTENIAVQACELPKNDGATIIKIPINSYEYFLIENRQYSFSDSLNEVYGFPRGIGFAYLKRDPETGVIMGGMTSDDSTFTPCYDFLLPGCGILIWHIDESVAYGDVDGNGINNFEDNTLQWDVHRRFIALEEADGFEDLGTIVTYGEPEDYFYYPNNQHFGPNSNPSTESNDGGFTGISVGGIGFGNHPQMDFDIGFDHGAPTAIVKTTIYPLYAPMVAADLDTDGVDEIITEGYTSESGYYYGCVLIWDANAEPFIDNGYTVEGVEFDGSHITVPYPVAAKVNADRVTIPAIGDINGDNSPEVVGLDIEGNLHVWDPREIDLDGFMTELPGFPVNLDSSATRSVSLWDVDRDDNDEIIAFCGENWFLVGEGGSRLITGNARGEITGIAPCADGLYVLAKREKAKLYLFDWFGEIIWDVQLSRGDVSYLVRADLDGDGEPTEVACASRSGTIYAFDSEGDPLDYFPASVNDTSLSSPVAADFDGDGVIELLISGRDGFYVYEPTGFAHENSPFEIDDILASPVFTGDYAILPSQRGVVIGIDESGSSPDYFPLNGGPSDATPCFFSDPDGKVGLAMGSTNGSLFIWHNLENELLDGAWPMWGADAAHTFLQPVAGDTPQSCGKLAIDFFYCYPNPAERFTNFRYELSGPTGVAEVCIDVFDVAGNHIAQVTGPGDTGTPLEKEWHTEKVGSGIYWAKLSVSSGGDTVTEMFRVAVIR